MTEGIAAQNAIVNGSRLSYVEKYSNEINDRTSDPWLLVSFL